LPFYKRGLNGYSIQKVIEKLEQNISLIDQESV